eukprot:scaffold547325_cov24-Prasinocladus_malaysianus.AAC.1
MAGQNDEISRCRRTRIIAQKCIGQVTSPKVLAAVLIKGVSLHASRDAMAASTEGLGHNVENTQYL